jgi:hypothetical protein
LKTSCTSDMNVLLVQREGVDLHTTLLSSDTSRAILRFYRPKKRGYGVVVTSSSLGSILSLISELNWYIRRYVAEVLIEVATDQYCTAELAHEIYQRNESFHEPWEFRRLIVIGDDTALCSEWMEPGRTKEELVPEYEDSALVLEVRCTKREFEAR